MRDRISTNWWLFLARGILALVLGILVPFFPIAAILTIAVLFGVYALLDGSLALVSAARMSRDDGRWIWLIAEGIVGVAAGAYVLLAPGIAILALVWLVGIWAVITGILALGSAFTIRRHMAHEIFWLLGAIVSIVFGFAVFFAPAIGAWMLIYFLSIYAIVAGIVSITFALRLRNAQSTTTAATV
jgi:uncharacterized membrane protein HdeD (DUF308 family)